MSGWLWPHFISSASCLRYNRIGFLASRTAHLIDIYAKAAILSSAKLSLLVLFRLVYAHLYTASAAHTSLQAPPLTD